MSAAFLLKMEQSKAFLFQGEINSARQILMELNTESNVENRWKDHYLGIIKMRQGFFDEAIVLFLNTLSKNGNHLSVILDLAACYQHTGQIFNWQKMVDLAEYEYNQNQDRIQISKKIQCLSLLAIFIEEKGQIAESLNIYNQLLDLVPNNDIRGNLSPEYIKVTAQILRIHGQYSIKSDVSKFYQCLTTHNAQNTNLDCDFEIQHALMIYELSFYGVETCLIRYRRICKNPVADSFEMNWINNDLFYGLLCRGHCEEALQFSKKINPSGNTFITAVLEILENKGIDQERFMDIVTTVTTTAQLRLLKIWIMNTQSIFALRKQSLLTNSFSKSTKQIWSHYFSVNHLLEPGAADLVLQVTDHFVKLNLTGHGLKLSKSFLEIFDLFTEASAIPLSDVLLKLWNSTGNESDTSRLRMRVSRLNQQLQTEFGLTNVFQLDKYSLKTKYKIIIAKSPAETISEPSN